MGSSLRQQDPLRYNRNMLRSLPWRFFSIISAGLLALTFKVALQAQAPSQQTGSVRVPLPKIPGPTKKDRTGLPPIPTFKDIASRVGLTASHIAASEAHYVIDSTSGGAGVFDCDDDGLLGLLLVNGSTVDRFRAGGDPMVTLHPHEAAGRF